MQKARGLSQTMRKVFPHTTDSAPFFVTISRVASLWFVLTVAVCPQAVARPTMSLDGQWQFRFAPDEQGETQRWFDSGAPFERAIKVPGCWDAQGVGEPTAKMRHNAIGVGWYRRSFSVPKDWQGKQVRLIIGGVHRTAKVWVNGQFLGEHIGYPVGFDFDITTNLCAGEQSVVMAVDSRHDWSRDPLVGTFDVIDFMDLDWGGIQEHVKLEALGNSWIDDAFVQPDPARKQATVALEFGGILAGTRLDFTVTERWKRRALAEGQVALDGAKTNLQIPLPDAPLWTPEKPKLLVLHLTLSRDGTNLDSREVIFGQRRLEVADRHFVLNGNLFFLRGYGDDFNFPRELLPPASVDFWKGYLQKRKDFGFNGVRHHSMMPTESYLEAADETGMFVQPELPLAYTEYLNRAKPEEYAVYKNVWRDYIRQMRNHPSVMSWCMGNEQWGGVPFGPELYKTAKAMDATRLVIDTDGLGADGNRPTLDYRSVQFDEHSMPWGASRAKYAVANTFDKPVVVHEMGNVCCLPDPGESRDCDGAIKPFWLEEMRAAVDRQGLAGELPEMLDASWHLQASLIKLNIESARASPGIGGYYQWLFRDYWCQSSGIESIAGHTRVLTQSMAREFNDDAVILWPGREANFRAGEEAHLSLYLSDYRAPGAARLDRLRVKLAGAVVELKPPANVGARGLVGPWSAILPIPAPSSPRRLLLIAEAGKARNQWPVWVWPLPPPPGSNVIVTPRLTPRVLRELTNGARVLLTDDRRTFPAQNASFKTAWWKGDARGDFVYGNRFAKHKALAAFPNDGYGDLQAYELLDNARAMNLDEIPGQIEPIIRVLDTPETMRRMACLWEARAGRGKLLVSGLNLSTKPNQGDPAAEWMYVLLTRYASGGDFRPRAELSANWLAGRIREIKVPEADICIDGFDRVIDSSAETTRWQTDRETSAPILVVRQTDGRHELTWRTASIPKNRAGTNAVFVWSGGMGYRSQPDRGPFELRLDGRLLCEISFVRDSGQWPCQGGGALRYSITDRTDEDTFGIFVLTLPASRAVPGKSFDLTLSASGTGSYRWVSVAPYRDEAEWLRDQ